MKYKLYILILILCLFLGCNKTYAYTEARTCYYVSKDYEIQNGFRAVLKIRNNYSIFEQLTFENWNSLKKMAHLTIEQNGSKIESNGDTIINWYNASFFASRFDWFYDDTVENVKLEPIYDSFNKANDDTSPTCPEYLVFQHNNGYHAWATNDITKAEAALAEIKRVGTKGFIASYKNDQGQEITKEEYYSVLIDPDIEGSGVHIDENCDWLFGPEKGEAGYEDSLRYIIDMVLGYVRIIVPILIILLGTLDLAKATIASKADEMKKAQQQFIKRIIAGVAIFFIPLLVDIIMDLADYVWNYQTCGL